MKKATTIIAAALIAASAFGQAKSGITAELGVGIEPYKYSIEDAVPASLSGITAAVGYEFALSEISGLSAGLRFDYLGLGDYAENNYYKTTWKRAYLDVPVKYNAHFGGFYLNVGPTVKFLLSSKTTDTEKESGVTETIVNTDKCNTVQFALGAGLGYIFKGGFKLFVNYDYNLSNFAKKEYGEVKNSLINFGIGYRF